jgi:hypothetical protein
MMQYHRGLLHQRGQGWGALVKIEAKTVPKAVAKHAISAVVQAEGGLLESKQMQQTGQGLFKAPHVIYLQSEGRGWDGLFNYISAHRISKGLGGPNIPRRRLKRSEKQIVKV